MRVVIRSCRSLPVSAKPDGNVLRIARANTEGLRCLVRALPMFRFPFITNILKGQFPGGE